MRRIGGILLTVTGFLTCPCHLIITLPLLASLLAGTRLSGFLIRNTGLVVTFASIYFLGALALGYWLLFTPTRRENRRDAVCPTCEPGVHSHKRLGAENEVSTTGKRN
jgi:hypothetical protein